MRAQGILRLWGSLPGSVAGYIALLLLVLFVSACADSDPAEKRAYRAARAKGDILIGAGGPWSTSKGKALWAGMELALEEINAAGGIHGRALKAVKGDDESSVDVGREVARSFADNPDMDAVVGHMDSSLSLANSIMYEYYGMLMITPLSTAPELTRQGFRRVFRTIPDNALFGAGLARFANSRSLKRVMIYQVRNAYGADLANGFEKECEALGIAVPGRLAYDSESGAGIFRRDLTYWMENYVFDAILAAGSIPDAPLFIKEARGLGIQVPIITGEGLDTPELVNLAGKAAEGTFVGSAFLPDSPRQETREFVAAFFQKYGMTPDAEAAQGYDTIRILAKAIEKAGSTIPDKVAEALRGTTGWTGVTGIYRFDIYGNLAGRDIQMKVVRDGELVLFKESTSPAYGTGVSAHDNRR
jgi:branched-chain amino acid transport system substrate-binding protein